MIKSILNPKGGNKEYWKSNYVSNYNIGMCMCVCFIFSCLNFLENPKIIFKNIILYCWVGLFRYN